MSRFKTSKYRNAFSYAYKKEFWVNDLNVGSSLRAHSNNIKASCEFVAFHHDSSSVGTLAVLPLASCGRFRSFPQIGGHSGHVTDFDFSPFHDRLLATGSEDCYVKLWQLPAGGVEGVSSSVSATLGPFESHVESIHFHPAADNVVGISVGSCVKIWDVEHQAEKYSLDGHENTVQSYSWHGDGSLLATICKDNRDKKIRLFDPRAGTCTAETKAHSAVKDSQVLWLGDSNYILSAGYSMTREAELVLWDIHNFGKPLTRQTLGQSSGSPMLFFDEDSKMAFSAIKGESTILFYELTDKHPYLSRGPNVYHGTSPLKGLAAVPKRAVDVMSCQIVRFLQLTQNAIIPVGFHVQRKSHDYHGDLFPDTAGPEPAMTVQQWCDGANTKVAKVSMDPAKRQTATAPQTKKKPVEPVGKTSPTSQTRSSPTVSSKSPVEEEPAALPKSPPPVFVRSSKYRHVEGHTMHRSTHINHIPKLSSTVPGDSNAFQANRDRVAAVLATAGGQVGIFELSKPGRLDKDSVPTLQNTSNVMDLAFDPFNNHRLVVACEDAKIKVWEIPEGGLKETLTEPELCFTGHHEKPNVLCFHPQARSLLASAGYDCKVLIWNVDSSSVEITLDPIDEPLFAMSWSPDGCYLATYGKDFKLRLYDPRSSTHPLREGERVMGSRGARIAWIDEEHFVIAGFNKNSVRTVHLFNCRDLKASMAEVDADVSPATFIPFFDPDTQLLFLSGKGDRKITVMEYVKDKKPYLFEVNPFMCSAAHQAVSFLPKVLCDVKQVEIARAIRLLKESVEPIFFTVPRTRREFFQDDIFCDTRVTWESALSAREWLAGRNALQPCVSVCPKDMKPLSEAPKLAPAPKKFQSYDPNFKTDEEKKEELLAAMVTKMGDKDEKPLPQEHMDGVDSDEWSD